MKIQRIPSLAVIFGLANLALARNKRKPGPTQDGSSPLLWCEADLYILGFSGTKPILVEEQDIWPFPGQAVFKHGAYTVTVTVDDRCEPLRADGLIEGLHILKILSEQSKAR
ncbi:uncharacterized protein PgNI_11997 [Pyricularia grisea]|uniref:Uncharacterized protein n=1 Tax=Pyricularia grisea TaxID=148305 RepID=A0A6P8AQC6_PYRGI|nr:uncharacterized protein PgNI_11997 [Pyricularia grisea]TLD04270.1 hypothetical protein PgNI_11997 [Pyricularia grisea]